MVWAACAMLVPLLVSLLFGETRQVVAFAASFIVTGFLAGAVLFALRGQQATANRGELLLTPVVAWFVVPVFLALPFVFGGTVETFVDAYFEAVSGVTTTGATILESLSDVSATIIFWRAWLQWLGGFVTLVMVMSLFPILDLAGMQLSTNLLKHGEGDSMSDRIRGIIFNLWWVYGGLTVLCIVLLWVTGVPIFEGVCIGLSTLSTGGFMPHDGTIRTYNSSFTELVVVTFMIIGAINFSLHWAFLGGRFGVYRQEPETRRMVTLISFSAIVLMITLWNQRPNCER